jgi:hypothetical protein
MDIPFPILPQSSYSPDFSHSDIFLFPKFRTALEERKIQRVEDVITNSTNDSRRYHKHSLNSATKIGKYGGRGALLRKGTMLEWLIFNSWSR